MNRDLMMVEYGAWQRIVRHWHEHSGDINADDALVSAIKAWGEELVALRLSQASDVRERARAMNCTEESKHADA